jgi:hypothetical protein
MKPPPSASPTSTNSDLRLVRVLSKRKTEEGSYSALAEAIADCNPGGEPADPPRGARKKRPAGVDRRKLKALVEGRGDVVLSLKELRALDRYLERYGEGLAYVPLFEKPDLMQTLAESGRVTFLLGSKSGPEQNYFAHWDVLAMAEIQRGVQPSEMSPRFDIQDVLLHEDLDSAAESVEGGDWTEHLGDQGPSLVCLGSSRTSPATEAMLCRMFDCPAFKDPPPDQKDRVPFHFIWKPGLDHVFPSHFHLQSDDICSRDPDAAKAVREREASAVVTAEDVFVDRVRPGEKRNTYGVCVAQRRRRGQVWLVLAGITGVATFVAAKLAKNLATRLHKQEPGQDSAVYWAVVKAQVAEDWHGPLTGVRSFAEESIVSGLHEWKPQ